MASKPKSPSSEAPRSPDSTHLTSLPASTSQPKSFLDHLPHGRKVLLRCWLGSWAAFVLILPQKSLSTMGNAAFFAFLTSFFLPPSFPVQFFLFVVSTLLIGVLLGWGIGSAAMRAATAVRDQVLLKSSLQQAKETAAGSANPDQVFKLEIFQGDFLDIRSSAVFGVFLGIGAFIFAMIRAYYKQLVFMSIFGTIAIDIYFHWPLFPFTQFKLLNGLLIPISSYVAIGIVVTIFVFPRTAHHEFLETVTMLLSQIKFLVDAQEDLLISAMQLRAARVSMFTIHQGLTQQGKFINAEFSWGRWNGGDARRLEEPLSSLLLDGLMSFVKYIGRNDFASAAVDSEPMESLSQSTGLTDTFLVQHMYRHNEASERQHSLRLVDILPLLREATSELRFSTSNALTAVSDTISLVNTTRWSWHSTADALAEQGQRLDSAAERLRGALAEFKETGRLRLLEPFEPHLGKAAAPLRGLYVCYVFSASMVVVSEAILTVVETVLEITSKRRNNRLWAPKGLRQLAHAFFVEKAIEGDSRAYGETQEIKEVIPEGEEGKFRRDPDSRPPTNVMQKMMNGLHGIYQWTKTPEALFVFRYVFITIALWVPAVIKTTAQFYYVQKGIWALVMAQTTLLIYAGDQLYNYVIRLTGTFIGLIVGLLVWYIGNAHSRGNAYGSAASVGVFIVPIMFIRLFAPQQYLQGVILMASTVALIVGYSWVDGHLPVISNVGIGWPVAWKRWTLVMIGCAASFIVMLFPAKSARKAVRVEMKSGLSPKATSFRSDLSVVTLQLRNLKETASYARWEGNVRGHWPYEEYDKLIDIQQEMVSVFAQLASALLELDNKWRSDFLHHTKVVNPNFISDVLSVFSLVAQSLHTGEPMHTVLPQSLLDRLLYHDAAAEASPSTTTVDRVEQLRSLDYLFYATAAIDVLHITELLDELHSITRNLCGEVPFKGFEQWRDVHQRAHPPAPAATA
ncbi:hypothetical protein BC826DRAFT_1092011 [Russula brevipes]|nr:hypothetical protein BC826DRAFT_1092011 [Russula brevipes]